MQWCYRSTASKALSVVKCRQQTWAVMLRTIRVCAMCYPCTSQRLDLSIASLSQELCWDSEGILLSDPFPARLVQMSLLFSSWHLCGKNAMWFEFSSKLPNIGQAVSCLWEWLPSNSSPWSAVVFKCCPGHSV